MIGADGKPYMSKPPTGQGAQKNFAVHGVEKPEPEVVGYVMNAGISSVRAPSSIASVQGHLNW